MSDYNNEPLAIIGIGCMFPGAGNTAAYWNNIREGVDAITEVPSTHWNPADYFNPDKQSPDMTYAMRGGFIGPLAFDPLYYGISPNNIEATDTTQLLGLVATREALLDAGYATATDSGDGRPFDRNRTSVILGVTGTLELVIPLGARLGHPLWRRALREAGLEDSVADDVVRRISEGYVPWQENSFPGLLGNVAAGRIANRFDLGGTNCVVDAACASSLGAIHMAAMELYAGRSDMAITGGLDTFNNIFMYMCFSKTPALSPTGNSRPFDSEGDGTILGEGLGVIILKRLSDAERDQDKIYALIRGIGSSSDGKGNAVYAPSAAGQQKALRQAYAQAGVSPASIELVEAHGTGTKVGDAVEARALSGVFREARPEGTWCAIGSVKSMIGHTKAAAGVAGLIKIALALRHKVLPPTIKVDQPLDLLQPGAAPVYINTIKRPWVQAEGHPRRAAVSAFGFGGSNFHAVLEERDRRKSAIEWDGRVLVFAFGAADRAGVAEQLQRLDAGQDWLQLRGVAAETLRRFDPGQPCRLVLVLEQGRSDPAGLIGSVRTRLATANAHWHTPDGAFFGTGGAPGKLAMLFPGQGAQYTGMLRDLACQFPSFLETLDTANQVMGQVIGQVMGNTDLGARLSDRIYPVPVFTDTAREDCESALRETQTAQPAIGTVSLGALRVLQSFGVHSEACAGHSFGELTALCCANRIHGDAFLALARQRGELMQRQGGDSGGMLAVIADAPAVFTVIEEEGLDLIVANHNAPNQLVLSGASDQIEHAAGVFKQRKLQARPLPVAAAFHSSFVAAAEQPLAEFLETIEFHQPDIPVYANTTAEPYPLDPAQARALLAGQLARPVEFVKLIENMHAAGVHSFIEVGPSAILTGLVKSILHDKPHIAMALDATKGRRSGQYDLACLLAQLAALGHACKLELWEAGYLELRLLDPEPKLCIPLTGANYVMPRKRTPPVEPKATRALTHAAPVTAVDLPAVSEGPDTEPAGTLGITTQSILALQKMQEQTAELHRRYLEGMEESQRTIRALLLREPGIPVMANPTLGRPSGTEAQGSLAPPSVTALLEAQAVTGAIQLGREPVPPQAAAPPSPPAPEPANHHENILLEVVAEKTGYPLEMLSLNMSLDTDLGIDSIKRVEILSALQERLPGMQQIPPEELGTFRLLQHIVEFMGQALPGGKVTVPAVPVPALPATAPAASLLQNTLLEVVAEKTGYPVEMLNLQMDLDADLGIDSIKRVEILSALQERLPGSPVVSPEELGRLQTLGQILEFMNTGAPAVSTKPKSASVPATAIELYRGVLELVPLTTDRAILELPAEAEIHLCDDGSPLAEAIATALCAAGVNACTVSYEEALAGHAAGLVILAPLSADDGFIESAFGLIRQRIPELQLLVGISRLGGAFGLAGWVAARPEAAGLAGMIKTAGKEWPGLCCRQIDIPASGADLDLAAAIAGELLKTGPVEVGIT
ncbi:MAG TPA: beta-ketoacyl synthase N-terminal-like domain-containing protein, partial [Candidatus Glassbacteria bacterium]|nr:beta-ketoacyl synthase N-terminal-like domain-containing protein [Candidatus Glassbacteria bacterium]